jgi:hypothetical protein
LEDAVAYTEKQTRTTRQGVAEGLGDVVKGIKRKVAGKTDPKDVVNDQGRKAKSAIDFAKKSTTPASKADEKKQIDRYNKVNGVVNKKVEEEVDFDSPEWDEKVKRVMAQGKEGPRKTVWDPVKRVYKTVPVNQLKQEQGGIAKGVEEGIIDNVKSMFKPKIKMNIEKASEELYVTLTLGDKTIARFTFDNIGKDLEAQDMSVNKEYRGQGLAKMVYDTLKQKGYKIHRSQHQTDDGAHFWDKNRPGTKSGSVWEGVAEGKDIENYHHTGLGADKKAQAHAKKLGHEWGAYRHPSADKHDNLHIVVKKHEAPSDLKGMTEAEKNPHTSAIGKALFRDLSKEKKASPQQKQRNQERWAKRQQERNNCEHCDGSGDVHGPDGEWRGVCHCQAGQGVTEAQPQTTPGSELHRMHSNTMSRYGEALNDLKKKIEFHKQGQAASQYKGSMNRMHAGKIRELEDQIKQLERQYGLNEGLS